MKNNKHITTKNFLLLELKTTSLLLTGLIRQKKILLSLIFIFIFVAFNLCAAPLQVMHEVVQVHVEAKSLRQARIEILKQARHELAKQKSQHMLGVSLDDEKLEALAQNSQLYILREKIGRIRRRGDKEFEAQVQMNINMQALRQQLLKQGLFYKFKNKPRVLTVVSFIDYIGASSFLWWQDVANNQQLVELKNSFDLQLAEQYRDKNFFQMILKPQPMSVQRKKASAVSRKNFYQLAKKNKAQVLVQGRVVVQSDTSSRGVQSDVPAAKKQFQLKAILDVYYVGDVHLEPLAQIRETYRFDDYKKLRPEFAKIKTQLAEKTTQTLNALWQNGDLGTQKVVLKVQHNLNPVDLESFKKQLALQVPSLRELKERFIYARVVGFEVRSFLSAQALADQIQASRLLPFKMRLKSVSGQSIDLRIER